MALAASPGRADDHDPPADGDDGAAGAGRSAGGSARSGGEAPGSTPWSRARAHPAFPVLWRAVAAWAVLVAVLVPLGALLAAADGDGVLAAPDRAVEEALGDPRPDVLRSALGPLTGVTDPFTVIAGVAGALPLLFVLRRRRQATVVVVALVLELAAFLTVSAIVGRDRPPSAPDDAPFTGSFPSGHAAIAVALWGGAAVVLWSLTDRRWVRALAVLGAVAAALGAGAARVVLGYHHLSDVVVGWGLGAVCLALGVALADRLATDDPPLLAPAPTGSQQRSPVPGRR